MAANIATERIDVSGTWRFRTDPEDVGLAGGWQHETMDEGMFTLPGTNADNGIGKPLDPAMAGSLRGVPCDDPDVPAGDEDKPRYAYPALRAFRQKRTYVAPLWLQREVAVPEPWRGKPLHVVFERTLGENRLWVDGTLVGAVDSISTPHEYAIPAALTDADSLTLTLRLDNRDRAHMGGKASAYSVDTQGLWAGVIGDMRIEVGALRNTDVDVRIEDDGRGIVVRYPSEPVGEVLPEICVEDRNGAAVAVSESTVTTDADGMVTAVFPVADASLNSWDEFNPAWYLVRVNVAGQRIEKMTGRTRIGVENRHIVLNGRRLFLRGNLDCGIFPDTGAPRTDEAFWRDVFSKQREYGLNHVRFHSWCPPEAAFRAADRLGMILAIEGPFWFDDWFDDVVGEHPEHYPFIAAECKAIARAFGHHPSFALFAAGNEMAGDMKFLSDVVADPIFHEHAILTTVSSNTTDGKRKFQPGDDFFVGVEYHRKGLRGNRFLDRMVEGSDLNYQEGAEEVPLPVISHEIGQYASYPDLSEIDSFAPASPMEPVNLKAIAGELERKGVRDRAGLWTERSVLFARDLYKAELEAALRTEGFSGYQILGLQDYPGQCTAMVGVLDSHWREKPGIDGAWFRAFNAPVAPYVELDRRVFETGERLDWAVRVRNAGPCDLEDATLTVEVHDEASVTLACGGRNVFSLEQGGCAVVARGVIELPELPAGYGACLTVSARLRGGDGLDITNGEDIWVFPAQDTSSKAEVEAEVTRDTWLSERIEAALAQGGTCVVTLDPARHANLRPGNYFPVFWSPVFFDTSDSQGALTHPNHPLFHRFPTHGYSEPHFKTLFESGVCFPCHHHNAIMENIPNFKDNTPTTFIEEYQVGPGRLIVTGFNLEGPDPATRAFRRALLDYAASDECRPEYALEFDQVRALFPEEETRPDTVVAGAGEDLALRRPAWADNERSARQGACRAVDGNPMTCWTAAAQTDGHWIVVDLGQPHHIGRVLAEPLNSDEVSYAIDLSDDGDTWRRVREAGELGALQETRMDERARYVRLSMVHPLNVAPGLIRLSVYEV